VEGGSARRPNTRHDGYGRERRYSGYGYFPRYGYAYPNYGYGYPSSNFSLGFSFGY
jgi:hypothetical protein